MLMITEKVDCGEIVLEYLDKTLFKMHLVIVFIT